MNEIKTMKDLRPLMLRAGLRDKRVVAGIVGANWGSDKSCLEIQCEYRFRGLTMGSY